MKVKRGFAQWFWVALLRIVYHMWVGLFIMDVFRLELR